MRRGAVLIFVALSSGCSREVIDVSVAGVFDLYSRDGSLLPAPVPQVFGGRECFNEMLSATLTIESNGEWSESMLVQHRCSGPGVEIIGPTASRYAGKFKLSREDPRVLVFDLDELEDEGDSQVAVINGNELRLSYTGGSTMQTHFFVYRRRTDGAGAT